MDDLKAFAASLPLQPGVYRMIDSEGAVIYVGKAKELRKRVSSYFQKSDHSPRISLMVSKIASIATTVTRTEAEALILENNLIKSLAPRYNILFRDDKSYPYIALTGHDFPRLAYYRGTLDKKSRFFGPFPNAGAAKEAIHLLQKIFRLRTCEDSVYGNRSRPCLLHQIHRCSGPCAGLVSKEAYMDDVKSAADFLNGRENELLDEIAEKMYRASSALQFEQAALYRDQMQSLRRVQEKQYVSSGNAVDADVIACASMGEAICVNLAMIRGGHHLGDRSFFPKNAEGSRIADVLEAFLSQHYLVSPAPSQIILEGRMDLSVLEDQLAREGKKIHIVSDPSGEKKIWLDMAGENARLALVRMLGERLNEAGRLEALKEALGLIEAPARIECFDISHIQGEATIASCVVYDRLGLKNGEYRRYNIHGKPGDDYGAMRMALEKRYKRIVQGEGIWPDLILIDGGKGQVGAAKEALINLGMDDVMLVGVAKGEGRKPENDRLIFPGSEKPLQLPRDNPGLLLVQKIRDEAHRFAISGHRAKRGKVRTTSRLEEIEGIGGKRRQNLLTRFGGMRGVLSASIEELEQTDGISRALAEKIYRHLH